MSSQYIKLGNSCNSYSAITSNKKFISIDNPVYYKTLTPMLYYPGQSTYLKHDNLLKLYPEELKAFKNINYSKKNDGKPNTCKSCHSN